MEITIQNNTENIVAVMNGSLDTLASEQAEPQIQQLERLTSKPLIIDCTKLQYIASSGLRLLLRLRKSYGADNNKVTLLNVNDNIMEVLRITNFDKMFIIE